MPKVGQSDKLIYLSTSACPACKARTLEPDETKVLGSKAGKHGTFIYYSCLLCGWNYQVYCSVADRRGANLVKAKAKRKK